MSPELIRLHLSQLQKAINKSNTNKYADNRKQEYFKNISTLFETINSKDFSKCSISELKSYKIIIDFCFISIEFLDNSVLTVIPHEIVYCLENALNDWDDTNKYIIVTSLANDLNKFCFNSYLSLNETFYDVFTAYFGIDFKHRLIQITLPKYLSQDYLANVVLYHELGHFVDQKFGITEKLSLSLSLGVKLTNHYGEFFSDIFAAQYIGEASNFYLHYIAHEAPDAESHPSTNSRIDLVNKFLNGEQDPILDDLKNATLKITGKELQDRRKIISDDDFKAFIPTNIVSDEELHSIFEMGWKLWMNPIPEFIDKHIGEFDKYRIINNLMEKSISNYMVVNKWNKHVPH